MGIYNFHTIKNEFNRQFILNGRRYTVVIRSELSTL